MALGAVEDSQFAVGFVGGGGDDGYGVGELVVGGGGDGDEAGVFAVGVSGGEGLVVLEDVLVGEAVGGAGHLADAGFLFGVGDVLGDFAFDVGLGDVGGEGG